MVPLWSPDFEGLEQVARYRSDLLHRTVECLLIGTGRGMEATDLADELERGIMQLRLSWSMIIVT
jgi:hypothetical protein